MISDAMSVKLALTLLDSIVVFAENEFVTDIVPVPFLGIGSPHGGLMIQFVLVIALATLFAKGGMVLFEISGWLVVPYVLLGIGAGWFLQTDTEKEATLQWWHERL